MLAGSGECIGVLILDTTPATVPGQHLFLPVRPEWFPPSR